MKNRITITLLAMSLVGCGAVSDLAELKQRISNGVGAKAYFIAKKQGAKKLLALKDRIEDVDFGLENGSQRQILTARKVGQSHLIVNFANGETDLFNIDTGQVIAVSDFNSEHAQIKSGWFFAYLKNDLSKLYRMKLETGERVLVNDYHPSRELWGQSEAARYAIQAGRWMYTILFTGGPTALSNADAKISFLLDSDLNVMTTEKNGFHNFYIVFPFSNMPVEHTDHVGAPNENAISHTFYLRSGRLATVMLTRKMDSAVFSAESFRFKTGMHEGLERTPIGEQLTLPACSPVFFDHRYTEHDSSRFILCKTYALRIMEQNDVFQTEMIPGSWEKGAKHFVTGEYIYWEESANVFRQRIDASAETEIVATGVVSWKAINGVLFYETSEGSFVSNGPQVYKHELNNIEQMTEVL